VIPDCPNCCGDSYIFFSPATVYTILDEAAPLTVYGVNSCSGSDVNLDHNLEFAAFCATTTLSFESMSAGQSRSRE
jgi:hypothetical protein